MKTIGVFLIGPSCYLEMTEDSKKWDKMFSEVEDGDQDISDDNENDVQSDSEKE